VIAGFGGELISHAYVEHQLLPAAAPAGAEIAAFERELTRWWRHASRVLGPASSARAVLDVAVIPLLRLLGHDRPMVAPHAIGLSGAVPSAHAVLLCIPWSFHMHATWRDAAKAGIEAGVPWAIAVNGRALRIVNCARTWSRAGIQFDFESVCSSPKSIAALWQIAKAMSIDRDRSGSLHDLLAASDAHAARVCGALGDGVLGSLPALADALAAGRGSRHRAGSLDQALTLVYRILFLLFAEARGLVPTWHELYRDAYTIESLTVRAGRGHTPGLWHALQAISRLAHAGCKAGDLEVTAFNGRLFSPRHAPLTEQRRVPDDVVRDVLLALATESTRHGRRRISYHDLGVEQLGSVYERVLECEPATRGSTTVLTRTSAERKRTGSFYTPRPITEFLVRRVLAPLTEDKSAHDILRLRVLDPSMGSGAFLVAACHYLGDCCERALVRDGRWIAAEVTAADRASLRRQVAERCLYGVDLNPTAVQLARLSLWLTTLAADRPLTFLDHHLAAGNSLIGARLADLSRPPRSDGTVGPPSPLPLIDDQLAALVSRQVLPARLRIAATPSDSVEAVREKERALAALQSTGSALTTWCVAADAWCGAALWPGSPPAPGVVAEWIAAATGGATTMPAAPLRASLDRARAIAREHGAFHWELAFPEVFVDEAGRQKPDAGFDAVIGNPPWDMLRADIGSPAARTAAKTATTAALRFFRSAGAYRYQGHGHANRYQLFLERALQLAKPGGRIGLILPSGIATDHGSAPLRRYLLDRTAIDTWLGFDNRRRIFPIHRSMRFVVFSTTAAGQTDVLRFRCGLTGVDALDAASPEMLAISSARLRSWSPDDVAIPDVPDATALGLMATIGDRVPALGDPAGWNVRFGRELNATDDRPHFAGLAEAVRGARLIPIVEGKQLAPFQVALDRSTLGIPRRAAATLLDPRTTIDRARIAYRDVASATNKLTLIAALLPAGAVSTHTIFVSKAALDAESQWCLLGLLNSLIANYLVRLQVTTHVTTTLMARLPVPRPSQASPAFSSLASIARSLATSGIEAGADDYVTLNAVAARLYGLSVAQYEHVIGTFPLLDARLREACLERYQQQSV
jgi:hypothetical protein